MPESDLFPPIKAWLEDRDFTVYAEVTTSYGSKRADAVGVRGNVLVVVELKTSLSLALIGQCHDWRTSAHYVYAAVPDRRSVQAGFGRSVLAQYGIGLLQVGDYGGVSCHVRPKLNRRPSPRSLRALRSALCPAQQMGLPGGSAGGGFVTPYSRTMERVRLYLIRERQVSRWDGQQREGWRTVREIVEAVETHYSNPKSGVGGALLKFEAEWCERRKVDGKWEFRAKEGFK